MFLGAICCLYGSNLPAETVATASIVDPLAISPIDPGTTTDRIGRRRDRDDYGLEAKTGVLVNDVSFMPHRRDTRYYGQVISAQLLFPSPGLLEALGSPRPYIGMSYANMADGINVFYGGLNWDHRFTRMVYVSGEFGGSVNNAKDLHNPNQEQYQAVGCRFLFHLAAAVGLQMSERFSVELYSDHSSNAHLCSPDGAVEAAGLRIGTRF